MFHKNRQTMYSMPVPRNRGLSCVANSETESSPAHGSSSRARKHTQERSRGPRQVQPLTRSRRAVPESGVPPGGHTWQPRHRSADRRRNCACALPFRSAPPPFLFPGSPRCPGHSSSSFAHEPGVVVWRKRGQGKIVRASSLQEPQRAKR